MLQADSNAIERADNLYRGLKGSDKDLIKAAVNEFIKMGVIQSIPMAAALGVQLFQNVVMFFKTLPITKTCHPRLRYCGNSEIEHGKKRQTVTIVSAAKPDMMLIDERVSTIVLPVLPTDHVFVDDEEDELLYAEEAENLPLS